MALSANAQNLVTNGSFEVNGGIGTQTVPSWTFAVTDTLSNVASKPVTSPDGGNGLFAIQNDGPDFVFPFLLMDTFVPIVDGQLYRGSFDVLLPTADGAKQISMGVQKQFGGQWTGVPAFRSSDPGFGDNLWHTVNFSFTGDLTDPGWRIGFSSEGGGGNRNIFVDNVVVLAVPEPSTAILFGLGALIPLFRRRRA